LRPASATSVNVRNPDGSPQLGSASFTLDVRDIGFG
jgi:hypothetical protein